MAYISRKITVFIRMEALLSVCLDRRSSTMSEDSGKVFFTSSRVVAC